MNRRWNSIAALEHLGGAMSRVAEDETAFGDRSAHYSLIVTSERDEVGVQKAEAWLKKVMIDGMNEVLNGPGVEGSSVPGEVETKIDKTWLGCPA